MNPAPNPADTIIDARWIAPVERPGVILQDHSLVVAAGAIMEVVPTSQTASYHAAKRYTLAEHILIPGLVNLHARAGMTLMRGLADDIPPADWTRGFAWPAAGRAADAGFVRDGASLACAEMLKAGITCFNDIYFFPDATAHAALQAGIRAALGIFVIEAPSPYASDAADYLAKGLDIRDALKGEPLLAFCMAPNAWHRMPDASLERIASYADKLDLPVHMHVHETRDEIRESLAVHRVRPLQRLQSLGLLGPTLIAAHAVHLEPAEIGLLAQHGCHVAHCPASSLKTASGIAPVSQLCANGVNVGLGTSGAPINNRLDILSEMRFAALLAKNTTGDPAALPAHQALEMATINGARALGLESRIGSIAVGKRADVVAIHLDTVRTAPWYHPLSQLLHAGGREHVSHVWVDGQLKVEDGRLLALDEAELRSKATYWQRRIRNEH